MCDDWLFDCAHPSISFQHPYNFCPRSARTLSVFGGKCDERAFDWMQSAEECECCVRVCATPQCSTLPRPYTSTTQVTHTTTHQWLVDGFQVLSAAQCDVRTLIVVRHCGSIRISRTCLQQTEPKFVVAAIESVYVYTLGVVQVRARARTSHRSPIVQGSARHSIFRFFFFSLG